MQSFEKKRPLKFLTVNFFIPCFLSESSDEEKKKKQFTTVLKDRFVSSFIFVVSILFNSGLFSAFILHQDCINIP